jgi:hypothetical protein
MPATVLPGLAARGGVLKFAPTRAVLRGRLALLLRLVPTILSLRLRRSQCTQRQGENSG